MNSYFALACALGERGTVRIDDYHALPQTETNDKAFKSGHYFSDKSPVPGLLGAPVVWVYRHTTMARIPLDFEGARYWATWLVSGGTAALLAAALTLIFTSREVKPAIAASAAALWVAATPLMGYAILFTSYLPACALGTVGIWLARPGPIPPDGRPSHVRVFAAGALLGAATWALNTMALTALALTPLVAWRGSPERDGARRRLIAWCAGGLLGASGYVVYELVAFRSLKPPYAWEYDPFFREQMARGLMGATRPRPLVAWLVTLHPFQGLFLWWPLTALAIIGCLWRVTERGERMEGYAALGVFVALLTYISAYFMWWGGWAYAPRHLIAAFPLLALGLTPLLKRRIPRIACFAVGGVSMIFNLAAVAVQPQPFPGLSDEALMRPELVTNWPSPFLGLQASFWREGHTDTNWGTALGLHGVASLAPLVLVWIVACVLLRCLPDAATGYPVVVRNS